METVFILFASALCLYLFLVLIKIIKKTWFTPIHIQHLLNSQGVRGPPYKFIHGNTKQILQIRSQTMSRPMEELSHDIFPRIQPHFHYWLNTYGKNFIWWRGTKAELIITEPEFVKEILINNREKAYDKPDIEGFLKKLLGDGLVTTKAEKWVKLRKLANHAFRTENLKNMVPVMVESSEIMLQRWKDYEGKEIEVFEQFKLYTSDVISKTAFGSSYVEGKSIFEMLRKMSILTSKNALKTKLPVFGKMWKTSDEIESEKLEQGMRDSIIRIIRKKEEILKESDSEGTDLLSILVKAHHDADESNRLTVDEMIDECKTFYFAGHETTNSLLSWTVLLLAIHTDWQENVRKEVLELFGQKHPNSEGLARMKTMDMIIKESLRLYPPVLTISRKVQHGVKLGDLFLPPNINLVILPLAVNRERQIWGEDAHLFKPERFSEGVAKATNNNLAAYFPFGLGPRNCVGMNFATNEAKISLSMILQRYAFTLSPTYRHSPVQVLTFLPAAWIASSPPLTLVPIYIVVHKACQYLFVSSVRTSITVKTIHACVFFFCH